MTVYSFVLFAHITGVLSMFACLSLEVLSLSRLRRASTLSEVRLWIEPVPRLSNIALGSLLVHPSHWSLPDDSNVGFRLCVAQGNSGGIPSNGTAGRSVRQTHP